jgi:thiol-disulfide isomerase/thioredoxin
MLYSGRMRALFLKIPLIASILILAAAPALAASGVHDIDLQDMKGGHHKLAEYKGKIVLLNFWATWCVPCAAEMPLLGEMQKRYKDKIVVLAASIDDPADHDKLQPFLEKHKAGNLTLMVGPTLDTLSDLNMGQALPDTLFIDANGNVVAMSTGALRRPVLERQLAEMTGTSAPKPSKKMGKKQGHTTKLGTKS